MAEQIADRLMKRNEPVGSRQAALADCLKSLPEDQRQLVKERYQDGSAMADIAQARQQSPNAIAVTIHRIRQALSRCIESRLREANA